MKLQAGLAVLFLIAGRLQQPSQETRKGAVEGRAVSAATGEPVAGVRMRLAVVADPGSPDYLKIPQSFSGSTDAEGKFVFEGLIPRKYFLMAEAGGYVIQDYGPFELGEERGAGDIVVRMKQASSVTGRVVSGTGPLEGIEVILTQPGYSSNGGKAFISNHTAQTDDRGEYRLFGIPAGRYYLMARAPTAPSLSRLNRAPGAPGTEEALRKYGTIYYPGTGDFSRASLIELKPGGELKGFDLVMPEQQTYRIKGRIVDGATGNPGTASVGIFPRNGVGITGSSFIAAPGTFEIPDVPPGEYIILGISYAPVPPRSRDARPVASEGPDRVVRADIDVVGSDVENVTLTFAPLARIPGRLLVEGAQTKDLQGLASFQAQLVDTQVIAGKARASVPLPARLVRTHSAPGTDGTFLYDGAIPRDYELRFGGLPGDAYVKEAMYGDVDVLVNPMKVSSDGRETLQIVVGMNGGQVQGVLLDGNKKPVSSAEVRLLPDVRTRRDLFKLGLTDGAGRFIIRGIAPGAYKLFAWEDPPDNAQFDPDFVRASEEKGVAIQISESSRLTRDVQRIAGAPQ